MARAVTTPARSSLHHRRLGRMRLLIFLPRPLDHPDQLQDRGQRRRLAARTPHRRLDAAESYADVWISVPTTPRFFWNSVVISHRLDPAGPAHRHPGRLVHGLRARPARPRTCPDVDAVDQDDARRRRADPDVPDLPAHSACSTPCSGLVHGILTLINLPIVDLDALHLLQARSPVDILEAARMDGATLRKGVALHPDCRWRCPGIASTLLLNFILAWNESLLDHHVSDGGRTAGPLTAFIASPFRRRRASSYAKLSAQPRPWPSRRS